MTDLKPFEWIALIGAFAWLPHLFSYIKDALSRPELRIITEKTVELGYTTLGPILNLRVAFAVKNKDIVISGIKFRLRHESGDEKIFTWHGVVQKMYQMNNPTFGPIPFEKVLSVLAIKLAPKDVEERFIRFQEPSYHTDKAPYEEKAAKKIIYMQVSGDTDFASFLKSEEMNDLYSFIKRSFNWKCGTYQLTFEVESPESFTLKSNMYEFSLSPIDIEHIEKNKELIEKSYEYQFLPVQKEELRKELIWAWRYPVLKDTT